MTPELKAEWIETLESGKYPKTKNFMHDECGYCCLGVLVEMTGIGFNETNPWYKNVDYNSDGRYYYPKSDGRYYYPKNDKLADTAGLTPIGLEHFGITGWQQNELMRLNDFNDTFDKVIAYIKENL
jgi:hypothetical protein